MEITIGLLLVAIFIIALAIAYIIYIEIPKRTSERYIRELQAETEMLSRIKPVVSNGAVFLPICGERGLEWRRHDVPPQAASQIEAVQQVDLKEDNSDLRIAYQIVTASIDKPTSDNRILAASNFTSGKVWQKGISELLRRGWIRTDSTGTYPAIGHDLTWVKNQIESVSAPFALPRADSREDRIKLAGNENGNALGNGGVGA